MSPSPFHDHPVVCWFGRRAMRRARRTAGDDVGGGRLRAGCRARLRGSGRHGGVGDRRLCPRRARRRRRRFGRETAGRRGGHVGLRGGGEALCHLREVLERVGQVPERLQGMTRLVIDGPADDVADGLHVLRQDRVAHVLGELARVGGERRNVGNDAAEAEAHDDLLRPRSAGWGWRERPRRSQRAWSSGERAPRGFRRA